MKRSLLVMCAIVATSAPALARPTKVALTKLDGDDDGIGKAVAAALDDTDIEMVPAKRVKRTMHKLELGDDPSDRDFKKLAAELEVDAVVTGKVEQAGHRLRLRIYTPEKKGKIFSVEFGNVKSAKFRKAVHAAVSERIAAVMPGDDDAAPAKPKKAKKEREAVAVDSPKNDDDATPAKPKKAKKERDAVADAKPSKREAVAADAPKQSIEAAPPAKSDEPSAPGDDREMPAGLVPETKLVSHVEPPVVHSASRAAVRLDVGTSVAARNLRFATTRVFDHAPPSFATKPVPGARLDAELYPFAFGDPTSALAGIGVAVDFDQSAALAIHPVIDPAVAIKATQRSYSVGLRYRIAFGSASTSPTLTVGAGYGRRTFAVDDAMQAALDLPNIDDKLFDPGVAFRLPIGSVVALSLGGRALLVTSGGAIESADQYGHATIFGGEASAGLEIVVRDRLALRLTGEATQINYRFSGTGTLATSRDGDPSTIDIKSATDRYIGGTATLAVIY